MAVTQDGTVQVESPEVVMSLLPLGASSHPEVWAWAGNTPTLTTGFSQLPGSMVLKAAAPPDAARALISPRRLSPPGCLFWFCPVFCFSLIATAPVSVNTLMLIHCGYSLWRFATPGIRGVCRAPFFACFTNIKLFNTRRGHCNPLPATGKAKCC